MLSWHCLYLKQVTLTPPPLSQWQTPSEAALTSGCSMIAVTHTHARTPTCAQIQRHCWIWFAYSNTHNAHAKHTHIAWQWPWYMYICKTGQPILCRPGPNHSSVLSRETTSQPLSLATGVTEENTWPWCIHPSLHPSLPPTLPSFIYWPLRIPSLLQIQQQWHACLHTSSNFMGPSSGREEWLPPIYTPHPHPQAPRLSIFNGDEMALTSTRSPSFIPKPPFQ